MIQGAEKRAIQKKKYIYIINNFVLNINLFKFLNLINFFKFI